jgi:hypothetical protein
MNLGMFTIIIQVDPIFTSSNEDSHLPQNKKKPQKKTFPSLSNLKLSGFLFWGRKFGQQRNELQPFGRL